MKNIAVIDVNGFVAAVNVYDDNYQPQPYEVEVTEVTGPAFIGGDYVDGYLYEPQPFPSWTRSQGVWVPPIGKPEGSCFWDEVVGQWVPLA